MKYGPQLDLSATPPKAAQKPKRLIAYGHTRVDLFHWMGRRNNPALIDYLNAENEYAKRVLAPTMGLQAELYEEMLSRIQQTDLSVPVKYGEWMYYSRTEQGAQYPIHCRKRIAADGWESSQEEVLLDENKEAAGKTFYEVGDYEVSPSGRYLAWTEDTRGFRQYRLRIRDLFTNKTLRLRREGVVSLAWAEDDNTLFYVTEDCDTKRANQLWRHRLYETQDDALYAERDARFNLMISKTRSRGYLLLSSSSHTTSEVRVLPAHNPNGRWRVVLPRKSCIEYEVDHHSDSFFLRINDKGRNFRLVEMPKDDWRREVWRERIAHSDDVVLEDINLYRDWLIVSERHRGLAQLRITELASGESHHVAFADPAYVVDLDDLPEWDSALLRYTYESLTTPDSLYEYDPRSKQARLLKRQAVLGDFDPAHYRSQRVMAQAADGASIPISLVYRQGLQQDGRAPLWLDGYGAYGMSNDPWFSVTRLSLLDRGWVFAIAHVRGGGELGETWHDAGRLEYKENSFSDYEACARALIAQRFTSEKRILAQGGSAGGLLVATALNRYPELFGGAILEVPFVDVLTTMQDASLPLTVGEYEEWGNPARAKDYQCVARYSPYDNIENRDYPPMLVETGLHDSQVMVWEPAKYVAKLRLQKTDRNPLLFITHMEAGHGGASGRYDQLRERARQIAFALSVLSDAQ